MFTDDSMTTVCSTKQFTSDSVTVYSKAVAARAEVEQIIKRHRGAIFVLANNEAPIAGKPGRVFPVMGSIKVTKKLALKYLRDAYSDTLVSRGALVGIAKHGDCLFI